MRQRNRLGQLIRPSKAFDVMTDKPFVRNNFFTGRLLTAEDLTLEQQYFRGKQRLHNRALHGFGIVVGLEVDQSNKKNTFVVAPGLALDCQGNEIVVTGPVELAFPGSVAGPTTYVVIRYRETESGLGFAEEKLDGTGLHPRIEEGFITTFNNVNLNQRHRHSNGRWQACGNPHGLVLARLRRTSGQWRLDRRLQRPHVK